MSDHLGGINPQHAVAGFSGALASLPFMKPATKWLAIGSVFAGIGTAMFLTPGVAELLHKTAMVSGPLSANTERGLAFLLGLTAMVLLPAILGAATWVRDNIGKIMERVSGTKGDRDGRL